MSEGPGGGQPAHRALGLTDDELEAIVEVLGRSPSEAELAMYAVMWSEHCSYKSSRRHLARLPTEARHVLVGPGENAGVIDVGGGLAVALRIESHNHPSFVEPYQGAATGVGGILRDIFAVGARPIALMDALFFGPLEDPHSRYICDGVVRGIAGYGNAVGVPTVGGQLTFDPSYARNPLVNVFCLGLVPADRLVLGRASGVGNLAVLLGSRTGRDGIGGVSLLASSGFGVAADEASKRPSVQVGDPYEEKRLIEACLELIDAGLVVGIQDLGGAGLACAASETAARAGLGMDLDVSAVALREAPMAPAEVLTSESQERMLAIVAPGSLGALEEVCRRWEVEARVVGRVTAPDPDGVGRLRVRSGAGGPVVAEVPARSLADGAPRYDRPAAPPADLAERRAADPALLSAPDDTGADLLALLVDPSFVYRQYDHQLFLNTVLGPGEAHATVLRLAAPGVAATGRGLALSTDANPGWCDVDPRLGTAATVAESALNVSLAGGEPRALVDCLNLGNPEHPEVMWQLVEVVEGLREACLALSLPVVGGNVSLYNEAGGVDIVPTPVVTVVGLLEGLARRPVGIGWRAGDALVVLGAGTPSLAGSRWARTLRGHRGGSLPALDLGAHARLCGLVRELVGAQARGGPELVTGAHHLADGGLGVALAECAARAGVGCTVEVGDHRALFGESPGRALVAAARPDEVLARAAAHGVPAAVVGRAGGERLVLGALADLGLDEVASALARSVAARFEEAATSA